MLTKSAEVVHCYRTFYPESQGGLEQVILELVQNAHNSTVLTLSDNPGEQLFGKNSVLVKAKKRWVSIASCCIGPSFVKALSSQKAELLHFHFPWPFGDLAYLLGGNSRPLVITYHSDIVRQRILGALYRPLMHWFLAKADRIVATSPNYLNTSPVLRAYKEKVEVIPLGVSEECYPDPNSQTLSDVEQRFGRDFMLFVGVLRYYKGLEFLIRAAAGQPYRVVVAGKGPDLVRLKALAHEVGAENVVFAGFVSEEEKAALMILCRAVVFPSHLRSEAFGVTLIEGLMHGKPLISCEIGTGTSYVNQSGETGVVIPPADVIALREAMTYLWCTPERARSMGLAARRRYEDFFTGERMAAAYQKLYEDVLEKRLID